MNQDKNKRKSMRIAKIILPLLLIATLFIPLPLVTVNVGLASIYIFSIGLFIKSCIKKTFWKWLPYEVLCLSLFVLALNISSVRLILTTVSFHDKNYLLSFLLIEKSNWIVNIAAGIIFVLFFYISSVRGAAKLTEVNARFVLDSMNVRLFNIDNRLTLGEISSEQALAEKEKVRNNVDNASNLDGSCKIMAGSIKALCFTYLVVVIGGTLIGVLKNGYDVWISLKNYSFFSLINFCLFSLPLFILNITICLASSDYMRKENRDVQNILSKNN